MKMSILAERAKGTSAAELATKFGVSSARSGTEAAQTLTFNRNHSFGH